MNADTPQSATSPENGCEVVHRHTWQFTGRIGHINDVWIASTEWVCECGATRWTEDGRAPIEEVN